MDSSIKCQEIIEKMKPVQLINDIFLCKSTLKQLIHNVSTQINGYDFC